MFHEVDLNLNKYIIKTLNNYFLFLRYFFPQRKKPNKRDTGNESCVCVCVRERRYFILELYSEYTSLHSQ